MSILTSILWIIFYRLEFSIVYKHYINSWEQLKFYCFVYGFHNFVSNEFLYKHVNKFTSKTCYSDSKYYISLVHGLFFCSVINYYLIRMKLNVSTLIQNDIYSIICTLLPAEGRKMWFPRNIFQCSAIELQ